ncbi:MAG: hypothetical protein ACL7AX_13460 [Candidatus Arsenophonus phytopathogenicus]
MNNVQGINVFKKTDLHSKWILNQQEEREICKIPIEWNERVKVKELDIKEENADHQLSMDEGQISMSHGTTQKK